MELTYTEYKNDFLGEMTENEFNKFLVVTSFIIEDYLLDMTLQVDRFCSYEMMDETRLWQERDNVKSVANDNYIVTYRNSQTYLKRMNVIYKKYHSITVEWL